MKQPSEIRSHLVSRTWTLRIKLKDAVMFVLKEDPQGLAVANLKDAQ